MSLKLMVRVMETIDVTRPQQAVLLAMAENASDDGGQCFPSIDLIAWKAGYKPRNVVDIIRELRHAGVLEEVAPASGTRSVEYQMHLDRAPQKASFKDWQRVNGRHAKRDLGVQSHEKNTREIAPVQNDEGCNLTSLGVQSHGTGVQSHEKNTREIAPRTVSRTVIEPSGNRGGGKAAPQPPPPPRAKTTSRAHRLPDDWTPTEDLIQAVMVKHRMDRAAVEFETEKFREHFGGNGKPMLRWDLAWQKWMRSVPEFVRARSPALNGRAGQRDIGHSNEHLMAIARGEA